MNQRNDKYSAVLETVRAWPARQRYLLIQDVLKTLEGDAKAMQGEDTLSLALGLLSTGKTAPTDEEVAAWLEEHRLEKYG
jgi:hypothetical protein